MVAESRRLLRLTNASSRASGRIVRLNCFRNEVQVFVVCCLPWVRGDQSAAPVCSSTRPWDRHPAPHPPPPRSSPQPPRRHGTAERVDSATVRRPFGAQPPVLRRCRSCYADVRRGDGGQLPRVGGQPQRRFVQLPLAAAAGAPPPPPALDVERAPLAPPAGARATPCMRGWKRGEGRRRGTHGAREYGGMTRAPRERTRVQRRRRRR